MRQILSILFIFPRIFLCKYACTPSARMSYEPFPYASLFSRPTDAYSLTPKEENAFHIIGVALGELKKRYDYNHVILQCKTF